MTRITVLAATLAWGLACAGAAAPQKTSTLRSATPAVASAGAPAGTGAAKPKVICEWERPTGSNRAVKVCRDATQDDLDRLELLESVRKMQQLGPGAGK